MKKIRFMLVVIGLSACAQKAVVTDSRVDAILARSQIEDTVNRLFISTDNKDWTKVQSLFTPNVQFDMSSLTGIAPQTLTPKAITDLWVEGLTPVAQVHHQSGNFLVTLDSNGADVFCYGTATHYHNPQFKKKSVVSFVGSYNVHLVRAGAEWKISSLKFNKKYVE